MDGWVDDEVEFSDVLFPDDNAMLPLRAWLSFTYGWGKEEGTIEDSATCLHINDQ